MTLVLFCHSKANAAQYDACEGEGVEVGQEKELGHDEDEDDQGSDREDRGEDRLPSCLEHLGERDAEGNQGGEEHEEVGCLRGGVRVQEVGHVDRFLKGYGVEDDALDDDLQLRFDQRLDV